MALAFDTETFLIAPGTIAPPLVCLTWCSGAMAGLVSADDAPAWFASALASGERLIGHNVAYDVFVLLNEAPELLPAVIAHYSAGLFGDTMLREQLLDIAKGSFRFNETEDPDTGEVTRYPIQYALADIASRRLSQVLDKSADGWRLRYSELADVPVEAWPPEARSYALDDARATHGVWSAQELDPAIATLRADEAAQVRAAIALHSLSARGVTVDLGAVTSLRSALTLTRDRTRAELSPLGVWRTNGTKDTKRVQALVTGAYETLGAPAPMTSGTAKRAPGVSTSAATLKDSGHPGLVALAGLAGTEKLLTAFIPGLGAGAVAPIGCRYNVLVESGRTSCSGVKVGAVRGVQLQQLPRAGGVRECFVPRPGYLFASVDYDTLELRCLAQACLDLVGYSVLADTLRANPNHDLHLDLAATLLGITFDEALARKGEPAIKAARQRAKPINFGFPGGLGVVSFRVFAWHQYGVRFTEAEALAARETWRARWPEVGELQRLVGAAIDRVTDTCNVVQPRSGRLRGRCKYTEACNTFFQGLAADGAKRALYRVWSELPGVYPVAFLHDEILAEVPEETAATAAEDLARVMVEAMTEVVPDVPITASPALMRRWYKGAETVRDARGVLVPWEPKGP